MAKYNKCNYNNNNDNRYTESSLMEYGTFRSVSVVLVHEVFIGVVETAHKLYQALVRTDI